MISSLADLVHPLSEADFIAHLRARTPLLRRGGDADRYATLATWDAVIRAAADGTIPADRLRVTQGGKHLPKALYRDGDTVKPRVVEELMAKSGSIMANSVEPYLSGFTALCADVGEALGEHVSAGVIATIGPGGALGWHYDDADLAICQIEGRKRWIIQADPAIDPVPGLKPAVPDPDLPVELDIILEPGDFLFVPAGYRHRCENQAERSLHAGIFFWPLTIPRIYSLLRMEAIADPGQRRSLRGGTTGDEAALKEALIERIRSLSLAELRARHRATRPSI
jgi:lysine-specific demethylase/histidyl-hydroxylase NO66